MSSQLHRKPLLGSHSPGNEAIIHLLRRFPLFVDIPEGDLAQLASQVSLRDYRPDEVIFYQGDLADRIWLVWQGRVKIVHHDEDGREVILEIISPGEAFGGAVLFFPSHPATAKALQSCRLVSFSSALYADFLLQHPNVTLKLLRMLGTRHLSMINMQILAGERVERRMAHILLKLAIRLGKEEPEGTVITIPLTRQDLADMACTTLETAIRTLSRFRKEGLIHTRRGGYIVVTDFDGLEELTH